MEFITNNREDPTNHLIFPKLPPRDQASEFLESKNMKAPSRSKFVHKVPARTELELYKRRQDLDRSDNVLKQVMEHAKKTRKQLDAGWDNLNNKAIEFRNNIIYFEKFVRENEDKRERIRKKIQDDRQMYEQRCGDIKGLHEKIQMFQLVKTKLEEQMKSYKFYKIFLEDVVALAGKDFRDEYAVIHRHEVLRMARQEILAREEAREREIVEYKQYMNELLEEQRLKLMRLSVSANNLMTKWDGAKRKCLQWETVLNDVKDKLISKHSNIESVKYAADSLYSLICSRRDILPDPTTTIDQKLFEINNYIGCLEKVSTDLAKEEEPYKKKKKKIVKVANKKK